MRMRMQKPTTLLLVFMAATLPVLAAGPPAAASRSDWKRVQALPVGSDLRVSLERAEVFRGRLENAADDALMLRLPDGTQRTIKASQVVRIHHIQKDSIANGTLIGLGIGGAAGAALGASRDPEKTDLTRGGSALIFGSLGAAIGAGVGAIADRAKIEYQLVYERPMDSQPSSVRED